MSARRPITDEQTALPVIGHKTATHRVQWLHVLLPGRPNGHSGWIERRGTAAAVTHWHIIINTSERQVTVYQNGRPMRAFKAEVGKPSSPTPNGEFFIEEAVQLRPSDVGAPFALALSARSNVLQEFDGGPGQIALRRQDRYRELRRTRRQEQFEERRLIAEPSKHRPEWTVPTAQ